MKSDWTDRELSERLRRLSTTPPSTAFEQRLSLSLGLAATEIRASRSPEPPKARARRHPKLRGALWFVLALAGAVAAAQAWLASHTAVHAVEPGD